MLVILLWLTIDINYVIGRDTAVLMLSGAFIKGSCLITLAPGNLVNLIPEAVTENLFRFHLTTHCVAGSVLVHRIVPHVLC